MSTPDPAKKLAALVKKLRAAGDAPPRDIAHDERPEAADPVLWQLLFSFMAWESSVARAAAANKRLHTAMVDYNEMRVALTDELAGIMGERYPRAPERAARLRSALNDLYRREHAVTLARLADMPKRDARIYLESLEGAPAFVAARLLLLSLGGHAFPLDERLHHALAEEGAIPAELSIPDASGWLERHFRAGEAAEAYLLIESWFNDRPSPKAPKRAPRRAPEQPRERAESAAGKGAVAEKTRAARPRKPAKE